MHFGAVSSLTKQLSSTTAVSLTCSALSRNINPLLPPRGKLKQQLEPFKLDEVEDTLYIKKLQFNKLHHTLQNIEVNPSRLQQTALHKKSSIATASYEYCILK